MAKCKESWIEGYRKGLSERIESACFDSVNVTLMARLAEENERLQAEVARLNKAIDNCTGGSLTSCCCNFNDA